MPLRKPFLFFTFLFLLLSPFSNSFANEWEPTSLKGGLISTLSATSHKLFAGSAIGLYVSTDNGKVFHSRILAYDSSGKIDFVRVLASASDGDTVFIATIRGLYVSPDGGQTFSLQKIGQRELDHPFLHQLRTVRLINHSLSGTPQGKMPFVFAASRNGVARSPDQGKNWEVLLTMEKTGALKNFDVRPDGNLLLVAEKGLFIGKWGEPWKPLIIPQTSTVTEAACGPGQNLFAIADQAGVSTLFLSLNDGLTWNLVSDQNIFLDSKMAVFDDRLYVSGPEGLNTYSIKSKEYRIDKSLKAYPASFLVLLQKYLIVGTAGNGVWRKRLPLGENE